jgi:hypothetical protein
MGPSFVKPTHGVSCHAATGCSALTGESIVTSCAGPPSSTGRGSRASHGVAGLSWIDHPSRRRQGRGTPIGRAHRVVGSTP